MKVLVLISLVGGLMLSSCGGSSSKNNANVKEVNPADTIYLGDLREKFANDSVFFKIVAPDLMLMDYQCPILSQNWKALMAVMNIPIVP